MPRKIEYFLYFPDEVIARATADELVAHEYEVTVQASDDRWCVIASHDERPIQGIIARMRGMLTAFCEDRGGEFDGWGVSMDSPQKRRPWKR